MGAPAPLDTSLAKAICAYRIGRSRPIAMSAGPAGELFRTLAQAHIRARLSDDQQAHYVTIRDLARNAVTAARRGESPAAEHLFAQAEDYLSTAGLSTEPRLLARSWIDQAYAYLAARRRSWQESRDRLTSAMQADLALAEDFGYDIFHIGRVHTLHLWLRTEGQAGNHSAAVDLAQEIVDYIGGRRETLSVGTGWSAQRAAVAPEALRLALTARVAGEVGAQLAMCPPEEAARLLSRFPAWRRFEGHDFLGEIGDWGAAKDAFVAGDTRTFLDRAAPILEAGRRETTLWYATALDVCRACTALRPASTEPFRREVAEDAASWRDLPSDLQPPVLIGLLAGETQADPGRGYRHQPPTRRFHLFSAGLPRTGTTSLFTLFAGYRAGNEFMERETVGRCIERYSGALSEPDFRSFLRRRDSEGGLEVDSASFNHLYLDVLVEEFPEARFIFTIRSPYDWTNSYLKMLLSWHKRLTAAGGDLPEWMADYGRMLFGEFSWDWVASSAAIQERARPLAEAFARHWAHANRRALALLPRDRSLVVRTEELSRQRDAIARFAGLPADALTGSIHANASPDRGDLLHALGRSWVNERAAHYGADVLAATGLLQVEGSVPA